MVTVTFYKTKMNRSNRAYNGAALDTILTAASALTVTITPEVIPDTPFAVVSASNNNITASDIVLGGYDYISYSYGGKTWYAFIDDVQALATSVGNFFIYHTVDKWAMCVKYFTETFHMQGSVERAHVNDIKNANSSGNGYIDMSYTSATPEAPYNKMLVKRYRSVMRNMRDNWYYLYMYIANPNETGLTSAGDSYQYAEIDGKDISGSGLLCVYPAFFDEDTRSFYLVSHKKASPVTSLDDIEMFPLAALTSSAITALTLSKIPPVSGEGSFDVSFYGLKSLTEGDSDYNIPVWADEYFTANRFFTWTPTPADGLPQKLNYFEVMKPTSINITQLSTDIPSEITSGRISIAYTFSTYLNSIPKMNSRIYNPVYVAEDLLAVQDGDTILNPISTSAFKVGYTLDLKYMYILYPDIPSIDGGYTYVNGSARLKYIPNNNLFAPDVKIDYWTKLNAEQTGLQAQKSKFNAIVGAVFAPVTGAIGGGVAGTATQGKKQSAANFGLQAAGAAVGAVAGAVSGIGNAVYSVQSANNLQETADRQYNCGETTEYNTVGLYTSIFSKTENFLEQITVENQFDIIAPSLHRQGYNTFLQIDEIYTNHVRKYFNYFKGADVNVSGLPQNWCDDISNMFNSGVTLWQSDVENYERLNYPQNTGW